MALGSENLAEETWTLSFEWAANGGCNKKTGHTYLKAGDTNLFDIEDISDWNKTVTVKYGESGAATIDVPACDKSKRFTINTADLYNTTTYWHHFVVTGSEEGVKLTVTNSSSGDVVIDNVTLSDTNVAPTALVINPSCGGAVGIDELLLTYYVEGEVVQTPIAAYTKVDGISRTITATCDTEGATIQNSLDGETYTDGAEVTLSESCKLYFKAVKGTSESDVLEFDVEAGEAITLITPTINRTNNETVIITADQNSLLLSPTATIYYTYGEESGSFTGTKELTVEADATITAYAEAVGYTTSKTASRAVALFPTETETLESTTTRTSGWSEQGFSSETKTVSERTYATLLLDGEQWGDNIYLQTDGAWGLRANGNWYINDHLTSSWILMPDMQKGDIIVVDASFAAADAVNASFSKYAYGTKHAYEVEEDGNVELGLRKPDASTMDYLYGVYAYRPAEVVPAEVTFNFNASEHAVSNNGNEGDITDNETITEGDVTLTITPAEEGKTTPNRYWSTNKGPQLRMYSGMLTLEAGTKAIVKVVINQGKWNAENTFNGVTAATSEWEGNSTNVVLHIAGNTQMNSIVVTLADRDSDTTTFDVTTVGISNIAASQKAENAIFNLQGQRVEQTVKGLYIVNGKKVMVK